MTSPVLGGEDADIILKSTDGQEFLVHKEILASQSVTFRSLFEASHAAPGQTRPTIDVEEPASALQNFLPFLYPDLLSYPDFDKLSWSHVAAIWNSSIKYEVPWLEYFTEKWLK